jgi:hypothetical protein
MDEPGKTENLVLNLFPENLNVNHLCRSRIIDDLSVAGMIHPWLLYGWSPMAGAKNGLFGVILPFGRLS